MSLLDRKAPHTVLVQKRTLTRDAGGRPVFVADGPPVEHRCGVQPARDWSSAEESMAAGLQILEMAVIISRTWSGDENSHVIYGDSLYEMIGAPQHQNMSRRTSHWRVTVRRIGPAPATP